MNVGQVLERTSLACKKLGLKVATPVFDGITEKKVREYLKQAGLPTTGKSVLYDGARASVSIRRSSWATST